MMNILTITYLGLTIIGMILFPIAEKLLAKYVEILRESQISDIEYYEQGLDSYRTIRECVSKDFRVAMLFMFMAAALISIPLVVGSALTAFANMSYLRDMKK